MGRRGPTFARIDVALYPVLQDFDLSYSKYSGYSKGLMRALLVFSFVTLLAAVACAAGDEGDVPGNAAQDLDLVWEAWNALEENYADPDQLDESALAGGAIIRILELGELEPYPFLTDLGRMRGQVPATVPAAMTDVWKASRFYLESNPETPTGGYAQVLIDGVVSALPDPSAGYLTAEQFPEAQEQLDRSIEGSYLGIGARVVAQEGRILLFPFSDSPAEKAGIEPGDALLAVDGTPVGSATPSEVGDRVKGEEGTKVRLRIQRIAETEPLELDVFRGDVQLPTVASQLTQGGIGYIRVSRFRDNTGQQVFEALERLNQFDMLALILDLRVNPGGSADAAAEVAAQFLPPGELFREVEDRGGVRSQQLFPEEGPRISNDELIIATLVDERTRGEAEAVAAALQEAGRATLIGLPTFGEGSTYDFVPLSDGSALYIPTSRWYTADGAWVGDNPLQPDIIVEYREVPSGVGGEMQFNTAYEFLDGRLPLFR